MSVRVEMYAVLRFSWNCSARQYYTLDGCGDPVVCMEWCMVRMRYVVEEVGEYGVALCEKIVVRILLYVYVDVRSSV